MLKVFNIFKKKSNKSVNKQTEVFEITDYEQIKKVAIELQSMDSQIIIEISRLNLDYKKRVLDFLNGVIFVTNGSVTKISDDKYLFISSK